MATARIEFKPLPPPPPPVPDRVILDLSYAEAQVIVALIGPMSSTEFKASQSDYPKTVKRALVGDLLYKIYEAVIAAGVVAD